MVDLDRVVAGDCRAILPAWAAAGVRAQCVVTSPPYWGLRDYGDYDDMIGLEETPAQWVEELAHVFDLVRDVLADDGVLWLNVGDCYVSSPRGDSPQDRVPRPHCKNAQRIGRRSTAHQLSNTATGDLKPKDLVGLPWMLAFALRARGWWLRQDVVWHKPNPMPSSVRDRCTTAHEYLFLLSKSRRYYWDYDANSEPVSGTANPRGAGLNPKTAPVAGWADGPGAHSTREHAKNRKDAERASQGLRDSTKFGRGPGWRNRQNESFSAAISPAVVTRRNRRSVWSVPSQPLSEDHFAAFPERLVELCLASATRPGDLVIDPFMGSGTVGRVAERMGRRWLGCELSEEYVEIARRRTAQRGLSL